MTHFKPFVYIVSIILITFYTSCESENNSSSKEEITSMSTTERIDFLFQHFPDTSAMSRMTLALPDNIKKIQLGQIKPSEKFSQRVDEICNYYIQTDYNNPKTLREFDPNFGWYDKIWDMDVLYEWYWFWGILLGAALLSILCGNGAPITIVTVFYLFCGLLSFIFFVSSDPIDKEPYPSYEVIVSSDNKLLSDKEVKKVYEDEVHVLGVDSPEKSDSTLCDATTNIEIPESNTSSFKVSETDSIAANNIESAINFKKPSSEQSISSDDDLLSDKEVEKDHEDEVLALVVDSTEKSDSTIYDATTNIEISESDMNSSKVSETNSFTANNMKSAIDFKKPSSEQSKSFEVAYDSLVLQGISIDSISTLLGVSPDILVKSRFGCFVPSDRLAENIQKLCLNIENGDLSELEIEKGLKETDLQVLNTQIPQIVVDSIIASRNLKLEEEAANFAALYYSEQINDYLDNKFGFFTSIWQGIKYIFSSKEAYTKSIAEDIEKIISKDNTSGLLVLYINKYKHTIELENKITTNRNIHIKDFEELTLPVNINPITKEVKDKIAARGSLEAADLGYSITEMLVGWFICSIVLSLICNMVIAQQCKNEIREITSRLSPKSKFGKVLKGIVEIGSDIYYGNKKQQIIDKYANYKSIAGTCVTVIGYIITYFAFIAPSVNLELEINKLLTEEFISYYNSVGLPLTDIFNNLLLSN